MYDSFGHLVGGIEFGGVFTLNYLLALGVFTIRESPTAGMTDSSIWSLNVLNQEVRKVMCASLCIKKTRRNDQQDPAHAAATFVMSAFCSNSLSLLSLVVALFMSLQPTDIKHTRYPILIRCLRGAHN